MEVAGNGCGASRLPTMIHNMKTLRRAGLWAPLVLATACAWPDQGTGAGGVLRIDPRVDDLVAPGARIEKLADGFVFTEGPVWIEDEARLLFSDVQDNVLYQWTAEDGASPLISPVFEGDLTGRRTVSSNGLTLDYEGRLIICEHGNRLISRLENDGTRTTLVDSYQGSRLNSPNDAVYGADGWLYFTDPPYGLEGLEDSPLKELDFNGIYRLSPTGVLELLTSDQTRPNGIVLSPDERTLYVSNSDADRMVWFAYDVDDRGLRNARVFYDVTGEPGRRGSRRYDHRPVRKHLRNRTGWCLDFRPRRHPLGHHPTGRGAGERRGGGMTGVRFT